VSLWSQQQENIVTTTKDKLRAARQHRAADGLARAQERAAEKRAQEQAARQGPTPDKVLLSRADLNALGISYSRQHLFRLVREGRFPRPIALSGPQPYSRKVWRRADVERWLAGLNYTGDGKAA
jgi:predicted DNA-binding transcriptional regulator AlpA